MISDGCLAECFARLGTLNFFPKEDAVLQELGKLFGKLCRDDHEARLMVNAILDAGWNGHEGIMAAHASVVLPRRPRVDGCRLCANSGLRGRFRIAAHGSNDVEYILDDGDVFWQETHLRKVYPGKSHHVSHEQMMCSCALGQAMADKIKAPVGPYGRYGDPAGGDVKI